MTPNSALIGNLCPRVLAFVLGPSARLIKGDLSLPKDALGLIAAYLLFAIGLKGGITFPFNGLAGIPIYFEMARWMCE